MSNVNNSEPNSFYTEVQFFTEIHTPDVHQYTVGVPPSSLLSQEGYEVIHNAQHTLDMLDIVTQRGIVEDAQQNGLELSEDERAARTQHLQGGLFARGRDDSWAALADEVMPGIRPPRGADTFDMLESVRSHESKALNSYVDTLALRQRMQNFLGDVYNGTTLQRMHLGHIANLCRIDEIANDMQDPKNAQLALEYLQNQELTDPKWQSLIANFFAARR